MSLIKLFNVSTMQVLPICFVFEFNSTENFQRPGLMSKHSRNPLNTPVSLQFIKLQMYLLTKNNHLTYSQIKDVNGPDK